MFKNNVKDIKAEKVDLIFKLDIFQLFTLEIS